MPERLAYSERLKKTAKKMITAIGTITIATTLASCRYAPDPVPSPVPKELVECELNGRPGDPNPDTLTAGEAVGVFPGTLELSGPNDVIVQPVIELGQTSVLAAQELVFDAEVDGFRFVPLDRSQLKTARWRVDSSKGTPGEPGAMTASDECSPGNIIGRTYIHAQYLKFVQAAETPLTDQAPSNDQVITVPLSEADKDQYISVNQWPEGDVFGTRLSEVQAEQYRTGKPIYEVVVPVS